MCTVYIFTEYDLNARHRCKLHNIALLLYQSPVISQDSGQHSAFLRVFRERQLDRQAGPAGGDTTRAAGGAGYVVPRFEPTLEEDTFRCELGNFI